MQKRNYTGWALILSLLVAAACQSTNNKVGLVKLHLSDSDFAYLKGQYMYLMCGSDRIDSALVNDKLVTLDPNKDSNIVYHEVYAVEIWDEWKGVRYLKPIGFESSLAGKKIIFSSFLLEDNDIEIEPSLGRFDKDPLSSFSIAQRNEVYFKMISLEYSTSTEKHERKSIIDKNINKIERYPNSGYLLYALYMYRAQFTVDELKTQVASFERTKETLPVIELLEAYYPYAGNINKVYPTGLQVIDPKGQVQSIMPKNNYHVLVFWASWCGPCRAEIPSLKALYSKYHQKGLSITSISVDTKNENWQEALQHAQMPWPQYVSNGPYLKQLEQFFTVSSIPKTVLFAPDGKMIDMYEGYPNRLGEVLDSVYAQ